MINSVMATPQSKMLLGSDTNAVPQASFTLPVITLTEPVTATGKIVIEAPKMRNLINMMFFGTDAANEQFDLLIHRWYYKDAAAGGGTKLWVPQVAASVVNCTLGSAVGVSGEQPANTDFIADSVDSIEVDTANRQTAIITPGQCPWSLVLDSFGCQKIEVQFKNGSTAAATGNFLYIGD